MSCTLAGVITGSPQAMKVWSLWCASVLLLDKWSSPATAMTPPRGAVPLRLACLSASPLRSTPGPLPYQMPNTPSNFLLAGSNSSCCEPHTASTASSSLRPGLKTMSCAFRCLAASHSAWS